MSRLDAVSTRSGGVGGRPWTARRGALVLAGLLLMLGLHPGCSGIKPYPNGLPKNLQVRTTTDSGWFLWTVRTAVDVHRVGPDCSTTYAGTVQLDEASIDVGLPADAWSRLVFVFATSSFLANANSTITYDTWVKPKAGHAYEAAVTYEDDLYHVVIHEQEPGSSAPRRVPHHTAAACRA